MKTQVFPFHGILWKGMAAALVVAGESHAVMHNVDTGDTKSQQLANLPPFASRANIPGCSAVLIAPDVLLCASHCVNYAATGTTTASWNGQNRTGAVFTTIGADHLLVVTDTPFAGTLGKMTAPYAGSTENGRLAWKVGSGGNGVLGPGATGPFYDGIFRAMSTRIEVNNVASPPPAVTTDWIYYDFDGPPSQPSRTTSQYEGGTAPGDSGGPLYMYENGRWYVIAVTSGPDAGFYRDARVRTDIAQIESLTGHAWARPVTPALEMKWVAQDLVLASGAAVTSWPRQGGTEAWTNAASDGAVGTATFLPNATPAGKAAVDFPGTARLALPAASNPVTGETAFTVAMVVRADAVGAGTDTQWHANTGLLDAEEAGTVNDWGLALSAAGKAGFGAGNPDATAYGPGSSLADGQWHVIVATWDGAEVSGDAAGIDKNLAIYVDGVAQVSRVQGTEFLNVGRNGATLALGGSRSAARYLNGGIAEVRMYRGALPESSVEALVRELKTTYLAAPLDLQVTKPASSRVAVYADQGLALDGTFAGAAATLAISQISGPGPAAISSTATFPSRLTFPASGVYKFDIAATSGAETLRRPLLVEVLPAPTTGWTGRDVGAVTPAGSSSEAAGVFTLNAAGADIWGTTDAFRFVHRPMTGDMRMQCRVVSVQNTNAWAKAGLMFRDGTAAGAKNAFVAASPGNGITRQYRTTANGTTTSNVTAGLTAPYWIRLERRGDSFHTFRSVDGVTWTAHQPSVTVDLPDTAEGGLAFTSHVDGTTGQAVFDNLTVEPIRSGTTLAVASTWSTRNIGDAATAGAQVFGTNTLSLTGSGLGFQEIRDSMRFTSQDLAGDGEIVTRVTGFTSDNGGGAFGGIMLRSSMNRESSHVAATIISGGGLRFSRRTEDASYTEVTGEVVSAPCWLRLTRRGNDFTCHRSADGITWAQVGPAATLTDAPATMNAGLLVASINNNGNSVAHFDNIALSQSGDATLGPRITLPAGQNPALTNNFTLAATADQTVAWSWQQVSGPGTTIFRTQNSAVPQVAPSAAGSHVIRASALANGVTTFVDQAFDFRLNARWNFADAEGWIKGGSTGDPTFAGGILTAPVSGGDPQWYKLGSSYVGGDLAKHVLVRCRSTAAGNAQIFWGQATAGGFAGARVITSSSLPTNTWRTVLFDPSAHADWAGKRIIDLRFDPPGGAGSTFDIDWIALSDGDLDDDGMPDSHELTKAFDPDNAADGPLDADGDGWSNLDEWVTGTDSRNAASRLVTTLGPAGLTFTRVAGRSYVVQTSILLGGGWTFHATAPAGTGPVTIPLLANGGPRRFYRVVATLP